MLTVRQLQMIMPGCPIDKQDSYTTHLNAALISGMLNTVTRAAAFLAQLAHESGELHWWEELADGKAYEGRLDLGNTERGDGAKFKGHGPIQITGRANHLACGQALGLDLIANPRLLCEPGPGFQSSVWFWTVGAGQRLSMAAKARMPAGANLNDIADRPDFEAVTLAVNGGLRGYDQRLIYYRRALEVLGLTAKLV